MDDELKRLQKLAGVIKEEEDDEWDLVAGPEWDSKIWKIEFEYWHYNAYVGGEGNCRSASDDDFKDLVWVISVTVDENDLINKMPFLTDEIENKNIEAVEEWFKNEAYSDDLDEIYWWLMKHFKNELKDEGWYNSEGLPYEPNDSFQPYCPERTQLGSNWIITLLNKN